MLLAWPWRTNIPTPYGEMTKRHPMRTPFILLTGQLFWDGGSTWLYEKCILFAGTCRELWHTRSVREYSEYSTGIRHKIICWSASKPSNCTGKADIWWDWTIWNKSFWSSLLTTCNNYVETKFVRKSLEGTILHSTCPSKYIGPSSF